MRKAFLTGLALIAGGVLLAATATAQTKPDAKPAMKKEAPTKTVTVNKISASGVGEEIGTLTMRDTPHGLYIEPKLKGLPPGERGFHMHEKGNCGPGPNPQGAQAPGLAAGGHYDPKKSGKHLGPHGKDAHVGDMPVLIVDKDGTATIPILVGLFKLKDTAGKAFMIHAGGDNYSDQPEPLGGGGARIACGVAK